MLVHNVEQGSPEWQQVRLGIPTASEFCKIITPTGKPSTQEDAYINRLVAELLVGHPVETFEKTEWMTRGNELEQEAADFYSFQYEVTLETVGFCTNDAGTYGASPDRLCGDGLVELKCPAPHTHVQYMLDQKIDPKYIPQVQGQMLVTGAKWCDWVSYYPELPPVVIRVERDEDYLAKLEAALSLFHEKKEQRFNQLKGD